MMDIKIYYIKIKFTRNHQKFIISEVFLTDFLFSLFLITNLKLQFFIDSYFLQFPKRDLRVLINIVSDPPFLVWMCIWEKKIPTKWIPTKVRENLKFIVTFYITIFYLYLQELSEDHIRKDPFLSRRRRGETL